MRINSIASPAGARVVAVARAWVARAAALFGRQLTMAPVRFDLIAAAGMCRVDRRGRVIRYNSFPFAKYFEENLAITVSH